MHVGASAAGAHMPAAPAHDCGGPGTSTSQHRQPVLWGGQTLSTVRAPALGVGGGCLASDLGFCVADQTDTALTHLALLCAYTTYLH